MMLTFSLKDTVEVRRRKLRASRRKASIRFNFSILKVLLPVSLAQSQVHFLVQAPRGTESTSELLKSPKTKVWAT